jgi:hypothetical protein
MRRAVSARAHLYAMHNQCQPRPSVRCADSARALRSFTAGSGASVPRADSVRGFRSCFSAYISDDGALATALV